MYNCKCGRNFLKSTSLNSHKRFCNTHVKKEKVISKYKLSENLYECECKRQFNNHQSLNAHFTHCIIHRNGIPGTNESGLSFNKNGPWNKGLNKNLDERLKKSGELYTQNIKNGKFFPSFLGKHHTIETKEKLSKANAGKNNGYIRTKYYEIFCPYENKIINVQGTWELKYANYLNSNDIKWIKSRKISLKYKLFENDY
jgi:hypothetical protein